MHTNPESLRIGKPNVEDFSHYTNSFFSKGYVVIKNLFSAQLVSEWNSMYIKWTEAIYALMQQKPHMVSNLLEREPMLIWPAITHQCLIQLAERLMGPFVQIDSVVAVEDEGRDNEEGGVVSWHRDRFGWFPKTNTYQKPLGLVVICYLQRMTSHSGPLRVIPGSHMAPNLIHEKEKRKPHMDEELLFVEAGDTVVMHHNLVHSSTRPRRGTVRRFLGISYNMTGMIQ